MLSHLAPCDTGQRKTYRAARKKDLCCKPRTYVSARLQQEGSLLQPTCTRLYFRGSRHVKIRVRLCGKSLPCACVQENISAQVGVLSLRLRART